MYTRPSIPTAQLDWIIPLFDYLPEIRKAIYATNAIGSRSESVNMSRHKITKNRNSFSSDEALPKLLWLAPNNISKKWTIEAGAI